MKTMKTKFWNFFQPLDFSKLYMIKRYDYHSKPIKGWLGFFQLFVRKMLIVQHWKSKICRVYVLWTYGVWSGPWYLGINVIRLKTFGLTSGIRNPNTDGLDRNLLLLISYLKSATVQDEVKSKGEVRQVGSW